MRLPCGLIDRDAYLQSSAAQHLDGLFERRRVEHDGRRVVVALVVAAAPWPG